MNTLLTARLFFVIIVHAEFPASAKARAKIVFRHLNAIPNLTPFFSVKVHKRLDSDKN